MIERKEHPELVQRFRDAAKRFPETEAEFQKVCYEIWQLPKWELSVITLEIAASEANIGEGFRLAGMLIGYLQGLDKGDFQ